MKPCRDCGVPAAASARSCPSCGILNPVVQWIALPNGEHLTHREPAMAGGAMALAAPVFAPPAPAKSADPFAQDRLAGWAIFLLLFQAIAFLFVGGLIGGAIAGLISVPIGAALPARADGRKLPVPLSIGLIVLAVLIFAGRIVLRIQLPA